jgi:DNA-binding LacI/PurR family transcriptional regulator
MFEGVTPVDKLDPMPRHLQVQRILRGMVTSGRLERGEKIPAETEIARQLGVSKMTVNKAILALTAEGLFVREVGRGTFVAWSRRGGAGAARRGRGQGMIDAGDGHAAGTSADAVAVAPRIVVSFPDGATNVLDSYYYGALYRGVRDALSGTGTALTLGKFGDEELSRRAAPRAAAGTNGWLIVAPRAENVTAIEALWRAGGQVVVVGASWPGMVVPSVDSDNVGGAITAVRHLARLGHVRIALLFAEEAAANTRDRIVGYRRALSMARLPHRASWEVRAEHDWRAGEDAKARLRDLFRGHDAPEPPVSAVFAGGFHLALEAMNAAREAGLRVPEDVSVVGFDDPVSAPLVFPALTTVRQPLHAMGARGVERLLELLRGQRPRTTVREILPTELVIRSSAVAPPPGAHGPDLSAKAEPVPDDEAGQTLTTRPPSGIQRRR